MQSIDAAWVAGILEGEGSFGIYYKTSTTGENYPTFCCNLSMTDEDVVIKVANITGLGKVRGPVIPKNEHHKPVFHWKLTKKAHLQDLLPQILPFMGNRRTIKIQQMLELMESTARPLWRHGTRQGYEYHSCRCLDCKEANNARHRSRRLKNDIAGYAAIGWEAEEASEQSTV